MPERERMEQHRVYLHNKMSFNKFEIIDSKSLSWFWGLSSFFSTLQASQILRRIKKQRKIVIRTIARKWRNVEASEVSGMASWVVNKQPSRIIPTSWISYNVKCLPTSLNHFSFSRTIYSQCHNVTFQIYSLFLWHEASWDIWAGEVMHN